MRPLISLRTSFNQIRWTTQTAFDHEKTRKMLKWRSMERGKLFHCYFCLCFFQSSFSFNFFSLDFMIKHGFKEKRNYLCYFSSRTGKALFLFCFSLSSLVSFFLTFFQGMVENELILKIYAAENLPTMDQPKLELYGKFLDEIGSFFVPFFLPFLSCYPPFFSLFFILFPHLNLLFFNLKKILFFYFHFLSFSFLSDFYCFL